MSAIVFGGVSSRSLGDQLKGYGIMAVVGEDCPETLFWWDGAFHLVVERPCDRELDEGATRTQIEGLIRWRVTQWAQSMSAAFKPTRQKSCDKPLPCPDHPEAKRKGKKKTCPVVLTEKQVSPLKAPGAHDRFDSELARLARGAALAGPAGTDIHPIFREKSGDYVAQIEKALTAASSGEEDLRWSLFMEGSPALSKTLQSGYALFPEPMKRYATGQTKWEREKDAAISPWCFLLAVRGALLFRGSLRRMRWGRRAYPAFPFVFEGATVQLGKALFFQNVEIHLPTWTERHPRTLRELEVQMRQFQARLSSRGFAATAAEFRAAVAGRGVGAAFGAFHRFVLEGRRHGQGDRMGQAVPRGLTRVGSSTADLRLMVAPVAEAAWLDQFSTDRLRVVRARFDQAVNTAIDEPGLDAIRGVLEALWQVNRELLLPGAIRREFDDARRAPRPVPPLPARLWERALGDGLCASPAYRLGRALGSILGVRSNDGASIGPIMEHMLPVEYDWQRARWIVPDPLPSRLPRWSGFAPLADFRELFWSRWLNSVSIDRLPFRSARTAPLADVAGLLRGDVDVREVHRLAALFALLDWTGEQHAASTLNGVPLPISPGYAALRLWLDLGVAPAPQERPARDGDVARLVSLGNPSQVARASELALARLRTTGLPWSTEPRPTGKAVARFRATFATEEAARIALAIMIPITPEDTLALARRIWVPMDEQEIAV